MLNADVLPFIHHMAGKEDGNPHISPGGLVAPLLGRDGESFGLIQVSGRFEVDFTEEDEAVLTQLAQSGSTAIENTCSMAREQRARAEAEVQRVHLHEPLFSSMKTGSTSDMAPHRTCLQGSTGR